MMSGTNMMSLFDILVLGAGIYILYAAFLLLTRGELKEGVMVPKGDGNRCKDIETFAHIMKWPSLCMGVLAIISGAAGLYQDYVRSLPGGVYLTLNALLLAGIIWYVAANKKAQKTCF